MSLSFPICCIRRYDCGAIQYDCNTDCWLLRQAANTKQTFKDIQRNSLLKRSCAQLCASCFQQFLRDSGQSCAGLVTAMSLPHAEAASTYEILRDGQWLDDQKFGGLYLLGTASIFWFPIKWGANELRRLSQPHHTFKMSFWFWLIVDAPFFAGLFACESFRTLAAWRQPPQPPPRSLANASLQLKCPTTLPTFRVHPQCTVETRRVWVWGLKH